MMPVWIQAIRPKTLIASVAPVLIGTTMAFSAHAHHWIAAAAALLGAVAIQVGTNLCNDYFDFLKGADTAERLGPTRVTQAGLATPAHVKTAFILAFTLALAVGTYLVMRAGWPILSLGLISILCGVLYTSGPFPLAYVGLGDLFVFVFFGPVAVAGTYYVQSLAFSREALFAGLAPGFLSVGILAVNNLRDVEGDKKVGKKTLAVRWGTPFARLEYAVVILLGLSIPVGLILLTHGHFLVLTATFAALIVALTPLQKILLGQASGRDLNPLLARTGLILLIYCVTFSLSWIFS